MDNFQVGKLIRTLRNERKITQRQLAGQLGITEQAVSKWERGLGSPDISILAELSKILGVNIEGILAGDLQPNENDKGNMKHLKFYVCPDCGGILTSTGNADISCCGRMRSNLEPQPADNEHHLQAEIVEDEYYITSTHAMLKSHYISFIACVTSDRLLFTRLYPEQNAETRIPMTFRGSLYFYCTQHGLFREDIL